MSHRAIAEIAESFGMDIERVTDSPDERSFRIYKGANRVFAGAEEEVRKFFALYEKERPALFVESMYAYKE